MKWLFRSARARGVLCSLIAAYIRLVRSTSRFTVKGGERPAAYWDAKRPFILAFWHGRLLLAPIVWRADAPMRMLISNHRDGRIISGAIAHFGLGTIAGSRTTGARAKGGTAALRAMLKAIAAGENVGVTPDGPHGPAMRATDGIIVAARLSGAPILPLTYATTRRVILSSWDRFHLALPFSRGVFIWGEPISVAADADRGHMEASRLMLEEQLNRIGAEADRLCGHSPTVPVPAAIDEAPLRGRAA